MEKNGKELRRPTNPCGGERGDRCSVCTDVDGRARLRRKHWRKPGDFVGEGVLRERSLTQQLTKERRMHQNEGGWTCQRNHGVEKDDPTACRGTRMEKTGRLNSPGKTG